MRQAFYNMKKHYKIVLFTILTLISIFVSFIAISMILDFRPKNVEVVEISSQSDTIPDTVSILTWNIGYAGLGDNMDFFYDGGKSARDTKERTIKNLDSIIAYIKKNEHDIILLQEVDTDSKRSYYINQLEIIKKALPEYHTYFTYIYKSWFVPSPILHPSGRTKSGLMILSKYEPAEVLRFQYPSKSPFPLSLFDLKRALLRMKFTLSNGKSIYISNTHNTAFGKSEMAVIENDFIIDMIKEENSRGNKFIVGGDWNQYITNPDSLKINNSTYHPNKIDISKWKQHGEFYFDISSPSVRYNDHPYDETSCTNIVDLIFADKSIKVTEIKTDNLQFKNSDHNPVSAKVNIQTQVKPHCEVGNTI